MSKTSSVWTVGHSTRSLEELVAILHGADIEVLADIRTVPRSRRMPQFNTETLAEQLPQSGIGYVHLGNLGGFRRSHGDSPNDGWRNASFRGYADYMQTEQFTEALQELVDLAGNGRTAIMCSEALPWRCHRSLVADALTVHGIEVTHLLGGGRSQAHALTSFARVEGERITYPATEQLSLPGVAKER
jgi:uncharacterized protein (DUF488 family)